MLKVLQIHCDMLETSFIVTDIITTNSGLGETLFSHPVFFLLTPTPPCWTGLKEKTAQEVSAWAVSVTTIFVALVPVKSGKVTRNIVCIINALCRNAEKAFNATHTFVQHPIQNYINFI